MKVLNAQTPTYRVLENNDGSKTLALKGHIAKLDGTNFKSTDTLVNLGNIGEVAARPTPHNIITNATGDGASATIIVVRIQTNGDIT